MYRSFLRCDDPKGVVECETIRKYRSRSHKVKEKTRIQKTDENLEMSLSLMNKRYKGENKVPKGCDGNLIAPSSLQLTQVSRGYQSLNMPDSWSRDIMCDEKSEDIAKGIVKEALGLQQDSLIMLRKLQEEASPHSASFRRKHTMKPERDRIDAKMIGRTQASAGGSSSNCQEELKNVIKESLVRQNMFPKTTERLDSGSESFSTSTSQYSAVRTNSLFDPSFSVIASKMERGPSLILKLMGLEEAPSKSFPAEKALRENLDTMHFKGILKESFVEEPKFHVHHFNDTSSKQLGDLSHIALMKPLYQESVKSTYMRVPPKEFSITKLKAEIASSKTIKHRKDSSSTNMEKGPQFLKEVMKRDGKSGKVKLYCHTSQANETIDKKWKVQSMSRKQPQKDQYQRVIPSTKLRKLKSGSRIDKNEISCLQSTDSLTRRKNQMKIQSPVAESEPPKLTIEQIRKGEEKKIYSEIRALEDELLMLCEADACINKNGEKCKRMKSSSGDDNDIIKQRNGAMTAYSINGDKEGTAELKHFLSSSPSFIGHAKKLFNLEMDCPNTLQRDETIYSMANLRLYLDCAYELAERKSLHESQVVCSFLLSCGGDSRLHISLGRLVEEICNGIENLKLFYKEDSGDEEDFAGNDVFAMMEKDMKCNGEINSMWEKGWRRGFSADEAQLVVNKIEILLISGLIEELIVNL